MDIKNVDQIVDALVTRLTELPYGYETTTALLVKELFNDEEDLEAESLTLMEINQKLFEKAEQKGIKLDNSDSNDSIIGMPYNIPFKVYYKDPNEIDESGYIPKEYLK